VTPFRTLPRATRNRLSQPHVTSLPNRIRYRLREREAYRLPGWRQALGGASGGQPVNIPAIESRHWNFLEGIALMPKINGMASGHLETEPTKALSCTKREFGLRRALIGVLCKTLAGIAIGVLLGCALSHVN
jgi:hypothetical protein